MALRDQMGKSLFEKLCHQDEFKSKLFSLTYQYRMNEEIMKISNELVYGNQLQIDE